MRRWWRHELPAALLGPAGERLHSKVAAHLESADPAVLVDAQTTRDCVEVARTVTCRSGGRPPNYRDAHVAGLVHWLRADHVDPAAAAAERGRASAYFLLLLRRHRGAIPRSALAEITGMAAPHARKRDGVPLWSALAEQALAAFDEQGDEASLHCAALLLRFIVEAVDPADPTCSVYLAALVLTLRRQQEWAATPGIADEVLELARRAVDARPPDDPDRAVYVAQLVDVLTSIYLANGELARIDEAVTTGLSAVESASPVQQIAILTATATALHSRYLDTDALADLRRVIELERRAAALADAIPGSEAALLSALADSLTSLYLRTEDEAIGRDAVDVQRRALAAATPGTELHTEISYELACTMFGRFLRTQDRDDFDAAVQAAEAGMRIRAEARGDIARRHGLVALTHQFRHELTADLDDLRRAGEAYQAGADACAEDDPVRASYLLSSADMLLQLFRATVDDALADRATGLHRKAAAIATAPVADRLRATVGWAEGEVRRGRYDAAVAAYRTAIELLPLTAWHGLVRGDREYLLSLSAGMASDAAAAAIALGDPESALELLEEGRGVLLRQAFDYRRGPALLRAGHPALAAEMETVRRRLDAATGRGEADGLTDRRALAQRWDALIAEARSLEGFEDFLMPTPFERLRASADDGPVVVVNISELRCDAMALTKSGVSVVPLPDVTADAVNEQAGRLDSALDSAARDPLAPQAQLTSVLTWLGAQIVAPLLDEVAPRRCLGERLPRVWWCPTGALSSMPLHAALLPGGEAVFERCIPSYTATLRTLSRGRESATTGRSRPLVVGVASSADGSARLPSAGAETALVAPGLEGSTVLREEAATRAAVLAGLPTASWFHFAGHAEQRSWQDGGPVLHCWDGELAATDIATVALEYAEIAVLSACDTAFGDVELRDEAAHLSGAFQTAGFRHVVATQWPVNDRRARVAVRTFYRHVTGDAKTPDAARAAVAVWEVLRGERAAHPDRPAIWAPFVHFGP